MGTESIRGEGLAGSLAQSAERRVQSHCDEIRGHAVRDRVERFAEVLADVGHVVKLPQLEAVANGLRNLGRRQLLVTRFVSDRVDERYRFPNPLRGRAVR